MSIVKQTSRTIEVENFSLHEDKKQIEVQRSESSNAMNRKLNEDVEAHSSQIRATQVEVPKKASNQMIEEQFIKGDELEAHDVEKIEKWMKIDLFLLLYYFESIEVEYVKSM